MAVGLSVAGYLYFRDQGTVLGYKDAVSHLLIGRRVVVGQVTGFGQLGGIWLPLQHLLIATLAWNDSLYLSGFAGSVFSMAAYVGTVLGLYAVLKVATGDRWAGWVAAAVFGLSTNTLYLQATPMGEPLMYLGMVGAVLAVVLWYRTDRHRWLFLGSVTCALLVFVRYEAWVFGATLWLVVVHACLVRRHRILAGDQAGQAYLLVFGAYMGLSVLLWLLWGQVIFGDWLVWYHGTYSSIDQVSKLDLSQVGDLRRSLLTYGHGVRHVVGLPLVACALGGLALAAWFERFSPVVTAFLATLSPAVFMVYGLYSGSQPMRVEEVDGDLYNLRMAVVVLLPVALFSGYGVAVLRREVGARSQRSTGTAATVLATSSLAAVVALGGAAWADARSSGGASIVTHREASEAFASYSEQREIAAFVETETSGRVLVESIFNEWIVFPNQDRVIYEGSNELWAGALQDPGGDDTDVDVVVMRSTPGDTDSVYDNLYEDEVLAPYGVVLQTDNFLVWQRGVALDERGRE